MGRGTRDERVSRGRPPQSRPRRVNKILSKTLTHPKPETTLTMTYGVVRYTVGRREIVSPGIRKFEAAAKLARKYMADPTRSDRELYVVVERPSYSRIPVGIPPHQTVPVTEHEVDQPLQPEHETRYAVVTVRPPFHVVLQDGMPSIAAAWEVARQYFRTNRYNDVLYFVERHGLAIAVSDTPYVRAEPLEEDASDKYPWEVSDALGDMSLLSRPGGELGLGTPAQWGKGRRRRFIHRAR